MFWHWWLGGREGIQPVKTECWSGYLSGAWCRLAYSPADATVSCFSKIQTGFTFLVPTHPGSPEQRAVKWVCVFINLYIARPIYHFILIYTCGLTVVVKRICYVMLYVCVCVVTYVSWSYDLVPSLSITEMYGLLCSPSLSNESKNTPRPFQLSALPNTGPSSALRDVYHTACQGTVTSARLDMYDHRAQDQQPWRDHEWAL